MLPDAVHFIEGEVPFYRFKHLDETGLIRYGFSTRQGGESRRPYDSLNLGWTTRDDPDNVRENRRRFEAATGVAMNDPLNLVHGTEVTYFPHVPCGPAPESDACMTNTPGVALTLYTADCCPVLILDTQAPAFALVHAGWRGTFADAVGSAVAAMVAQFGSDPQHMRAAIGASIGPCCFEVHADVADPFRAALPQWEELCQPRSNKFHIDLWEINARLLERRGVPRSQIGVSGLCTACRPEWFFSFRRDARMTGRLATVCQLGVTRG